MLATARRQHKPSMNVKMRVRELDTHLMERCRESDSGWGDGHWWLGNNWREIQVGIPFLGRAVVARSGRLRETTGGNKNTEEILASAESRSLKKGDGGWFSVRSLPLPSIFPLPGCQALLFWKVNHRDNTSISQIPKSKHHLSDSFP